MSKKNTRTYGQALSQVSAWFRQKDWTVFDFQKECWQAVYEGHDGLLHAPTGSGKTHALWMPHILHWLQNPEASDRGLQLIWITPLKALAKDMERQFQQTVQDFNLSVRVERRTGDVSASVKKRQQTRMPEVLITTPESLHVLMAQKKHERYFKGLHTIVVDEWHELMGSKRGTQTELFLARARDVQPKVQTWGISATLGNMDEALEVLMGIYWIINSSLKEKNEAARISVPSSQS